MPSTAVADVGSPRRESFCDPREPRYASATQPARLAGRAALHGLNVLRFACSSVYAFALKVSVVYGSISPSRSEAHPLPAGPATSSAEFRTPTGSNLVGRQIDDESQASTNVATRVRRVGRRTLKTLPEMRFAKSVVHVRDYTLAGYQVLMHPSRMSVSSPPRCAPCEPRASAGPRASPCLSRQAAGCRVPEPIWSQRL